MRTSLQLRGYRIRKKSLGQAWCGGCFLQLSAYSSCTADSNQLPRFSREAPTESCARCFALGMGAARRCKLACFHGSSERSGFPRSPASPGRPQPVPGPMHPRYLDAELIGTSQNSLVHPTRISASAHNQPTQAPIGHTTLPLKRRYNRAPALRCVLLPHTLRHPLDALAALLRGVPLRTYAALAVLSCAASAPSPG